MPIKDPIPDRTEGDATTICHSEIAKIRTERILVQFIDFIHLFVQEGRDSNPAPGL